MADADLYTEPDWNTPTEKFYCAKNGLGSWWPCYMVKNASSPDVPASWYPVIIRNSSPFKTLKGAIRFVEATRARIAARSKN